MKIAIDLDGTAWSYPSFFAELMRALQARGHKVGILTAHNWKLQEPDLHLFRARGFPTPDFYLAKTAEEAGIPSREWKPKVMQEQGIDWLFDDMDDFDKISLYTTEKKVR